MKIGDMRQTYILVYGRGKGSLYRKDPGSLLLACICRHGNDPVSIESETDQEYPIATRKEILEHRKHQQFDESATVYPGTSI